MHRTLEAELMSGADQVRAYAQADFSASNQWFADQVAAQVAGVPQRAVDFGCGPADVIIRLARARTELHITGIDGSAAMIAAGREAVGAAGLEKSIALVVGYIPGAIAEGQRFDVVLSKDFLHHLPDPLMLWQEARRLGKPGATVYVMDLVRPATPAEARAIVERVAAHEDPILKEDFYNSLCAACTLDEVEDQLRQMALSLHVRQVSERHMFISGRL